MRPVQLNLVGQIIDHRYRVERCLGHGGMGTVWYAVHTQSLQPVALKTLDTLEGVTSTTIARCLKEARIAASLRSRHVVRVIDVQPHYRHGDWDLPYLVMELLEGCDFETFLLGRTSLAPSEVSWVITQVCKGLKEAHDHGIVHRDLKPANVFLTVDEEGTPLTKLCDFGLAKLTATGESFLGSSSESGRIAGTPRYMAPEQLRSPYRCTTATDQWAVGLFAFRLLSGREYFGNAGSALELSLRIAHDELPRPSEVSTKIPPNFDNWFGQSCNRDPARRFSSVRAQAAELVRLLEPPTQLQVAPGWGATVPNRNSHLESARHSHRATMGRGTTPHITYLAVSIGLSVGAMAFANHYLDRQVLAAQLRTTSPIQDLSATVAAPSETEPAAKEPANAQPLPSGSNAPSESQPEATRALPSASRSASRHRMLDAPAATPFAIRRTNVNASTKLEPGRESESIRGTTPSGGVCDRSVECASGICLAERCR